MQCEICHRPLTDPESIRRRVGPVCQIKRDWETQRDLQTSASLRNVNWAHMATLARRVWEFAEGFEFELPFEVNDAINDALEGAKKASWEMRGGQEGDSNLIPAATLAEIAAREIWDWMRGLNGLESRGVIFALSSRYAAYATNFAELVHGLDMARQIEEDARKNEKRWGKIAQRLERCRARDAERSENGRLREYRRGASSLRAFPSARKRRAKAAQGQLALEVVNTELV